MSGGKGKDISRQAANVLGAILQVAVPTFTFGGEGGRRIDEIQNPSLVVPGDYAFAIWSLIFALSLAYAVYQALPRSRGSVLLRRVGWFTAGAFWLDALWEVLVPAGLFYVPLVILAGILACLVLAFAGLVRTARERGFGVAERWLVALPLGPLFGWITAANAVSLPSGFVGAGSTSEAILGSVFLICGGLLASAVVLLAAGRRVPATFYLTYGLAVLWGLVGVVVAQYDRSVLTTGAAAISALILAFVLFAALRGSGRRRGAGATASPEIV